MVNKRLDYTPNLQDPRVIKRIRSAVGFTSALLSDHKPRQLAKTFIDKHFGSSNHQLSRYLRNQLLICVDETYDMERGICKSYISNNDNLINLLGFLDKKNGNKHSHITYPSVALLQNTAVEWAKTQYKTELDSLNFEYTEKKHRLYNEIQNIKSQARAKLLADRGLIYNYDIDTAAPVLLYQHSLKTPSATGEVCEVIEQYIKDKENIRNKLSQESSLPKENIKRIINAMFSGGFLTTYTDSVVFQMCNKDPAIVRFLQQHPFICGLKADINTMWAPIKADAPKTYYVTKTGKTRKRPFDPRAKWNIYFQLERMILDQVVGYCKELRTNYFLEHDGFRTSNKIDLQDLQLYIKCGTGYNITFKEETYENC